MSSSMMHRKHLMGRRGLLAMVAVATIMLRWESVEGFLVPPQRKWHPVRQQRRPCARETKSFRRKERNKDTGQSISTQHSEDPSLTTNDPIPDSKPEALHRALFEAKHRTKDKFYSVAVGKVTAKFHSVAQKGSIRKRVYEIAEHSWEQSVVCKRLFAKIRRLCSKLYSRIRRRKGAIKSIFKSAVTGHASTHLAEQTVEHAAQATASKQGNKLLEKAMAKQSVQASKRSGNLMAKYAESSGERAAARVAKSSSKRLSVRFAKGLTIALPVIGGFFAVVLFRQDWQRLQDERTLKESFTGSMIFFAGTTLADFVDMLLHFFLAYGLLFHLQRHWLAVAEEWSIGCAAVSTTCAVIGEILSFRTQNEKKKDLGAE